MAESKENKRRNGKLSLRPLKFEEAVKAFLQTKPECDKHNESTEKSEDLTS
jgi:hypothetical protein